MFSQACVILFTGGCPGVDGWCVRGWVGAQPTTPTPLSEMCRDTVSWWSVRILLECILVSIHFAQELNVTTGGSTRLALVYMEQTPKMICHLSI